MVPGRWGPEDDELCGMAIWPDVLGLPVRRRARSQQRSSDVSFSCWVGYSPSASLGQEYGGWEIQLNDANKQHGESSVQGRN